MRVLVVSTDQTLGDFLNRELPQAEFTIVPTRPGADFVRSVRQACPDVAVIDRVHARRDVAEMEVALLRDLRPEARVILVSEVPSKDDARLVEVGVFFYLSASPPLRLPELVQAAAVSIRQETHAKLRQGELR
jgi:DNA-binding response OmpR family regulator